MRLNIFVIISLIFAGAAFAEPLKFKTWKEQQILEAQNEVLRISVRLKSQKTNPKIEKFTVDDDIATSPRFDKGPEITDKDLRRAQENLEFAKVLTVEDYADVYIPGLQQNPEQFSKLMESLSKEELSQLMRILMKNKAQEANDNKRNKAILPGPVSISSSRNS